MDERTEIELLPSSYVKPLDIAAMFPASRPLEVDLGCGDGSFLLEMARLHPQRNFLGVERIPRRVRNICRAAARRTLRNVRVLCLESHYCIRYLLPPGSVAVMHIAFPDPWPKRRHQHRRLINQAFLTDAAIALEPEGELRFMTDAADYFQEVEQLTSQQNMLQVQQWSPPSQSALTQFEQKFRRAGAPIYRLLLRKP